MNQACPIILRSREKTTEILVYKDPKEGNQLLRGNIRPWENLPVACERELQEGSGVKAQSKTYIGVWDSDYDEQIWGFYLMDHGVFLPESWQHESQEKGVDYSEFFWQDLFARPSDDWHPVFRGALEYLQHRCQSYILTDKNISA